jgi:hypothetical protein
VLFRSLFDLEKNEYVLWEFKGMKSSDENRILAQCLLYAWILKKNTDLRSRIELFYFENRFQIEPFDSTWVDEKIHLLRSLFEEFRAVKESWIQNKDFQLLPKAEEKSICTRCFKKTGCYNAADMR